MTRSWSGSPRSPTSSDTIGNRAVRERRPYSVRNADTDAAAGEMSVAYAGDDIHTACLVPLVGGDRTLGLLGLYHRRDRRWPEDEVALLQAFADQAAVAIQNARLYHSVADQAARMRSIQDLSARLNGLSDVRAIAEAIVAEATALADYHDIRVYAVDWERRMCDPIAFTREMLDGDPADAEALLRVAIGEGFTGWVAEHGEPLLINDAIDDERGKTIEGTEDIPESMLLVPMLYEGRALGVIVLSQLGFNRFTTDDLQTMSIFAGYAAQAIANATTYGQLVAQSTELRRRADSQRHLLVTNARLLGTLDQADVLETIADGLREVVTYDNLSIYRTDHVRGAMMPVLTRERHAEQVSRYMIPFGRGLMGWSVEHAQPILANDALSDPRALQIPGTPPDPEAVIVVPLIADGEVLGALNVSRIGRQRGLLQRERLRARAAVRGAGIDRAAQCRYPSRHEPARRDRCPDRTRQPRCVPAGARPAHRGRGDGNDPQGTSPGGAHDGPRRVQVLQRPPRPSGGRRAPPRRGDRHLRGRPQRGPRLPVRRRRVRPDPARPDAERGGARRRAHPRCSRAPDGIGSRARSRSPSALPACRVTRTIEPA